MSDKRQRVGSSRLRFGSPIVETHHAPKAGKRFSAAPVARSDNARRDRILSTRDSGSERPVQVNGEFTFALTERIDKNRQTYLFAGIQMLGAVLFVRPDGPPGEGRRWRAVLKPYSGPGEIAREPSDAELDNAWDEQDKPQTGRYRR